MGDPATGFKVQSEEHTVSKFQVGAGGVEVVPGTGIWKPPIPVPCYVAPDEGDKHVVAFSVPDVHLTGFPDGKYRVSVELTGNWGESRLRESHLQSMTPLASGPGPSGEAENSRSVRQ